MKCTLKAEASGGGRQALLGGGKTAKSTARAGLFVDDLNDERDDRADDLPESSGKRSISLGT